LAEVLRLSNVVAGYGDTTVLHGVDLAVGQGSWTTIIGANGAGKSTLLKALAGIVPCREGSMTFEGRDITDLPSIERLRAGIGLVPQGRCNFPLLSVAENLKLGGYSRRLKASALAEESERVVKRFPRLRERWNVEAGNLSGGEQQMLEMAMAIVRAPRVLLLDEPTIGLAPVVIADVFREIRRLHGGGLTLVIVEQNTRKAMEIATRAVVMRMGRVVYDGAGGLDAETLGALFLGHRQP
jgi:branched-chain amino acid transport system ATP-binding protein